jgi:Sugar (pentulose and hexulose) kinases
MPTTPVIAILDVGKTNKKLFLYDELYNIVWEDSRMLPETKDEDGDPCEDLDVLNHWINEILIETKKAGDIEIRAINFSAYGASFVHVGLEEKPLTPLYNYLKPYPAKIKKQFYDQYGGELTFSMLTASPVLDSLNSGMQLYRIKYEKPELFSRIKYSLHLPQYLAWLMTGRANSDITSIGCHTNLWNFSQDYYHEWVYREGIIDKLPPIQSSGTVHPLITRGNQKNPASVLPDCLAGIGLHDSSAAIIPYLESFMEPFVLISTGTWCISMNPFNPDPLKIAELQNDCLCYLTFKGRPMKASRLFAGYEHEQQVERLSEYFQKDKNHYHGVSYDPDMVMHLKAENIHSSFNRSVSMVSASVFVQRELANFKNFEEAYHRLLMDIMDQQLKSTKLILQEDAVKRIFVDGGFSRNPIYMHLLAAAFPSVEVFAANIAQASAMGAAMAIHDHWNTRPLPSDIIELKYYKANY